MSSSLHTLPTTSKYLSVYYQPKIQDEPAEPQMHLSSLTDFRSSRAEPLVVSIEACFMSSFDEARRPGHILRTKGVAAVMQVASDVNAAARAGKRIMATASGIAIATTARVNLSALASLLRPAKNGLRRRGRLRTALI